MVPVADHAGQGFPPPINVETIRAAEARIIEAGREGGFPDCCVFFVADLWAPLMLSGIGRDSATMDVVMTYRNRVEAAGFAPGYIPCPACLRRAGKEEDK
jgi:hypothetical protein